ncbi:27141_t:CDS:2, partial [Racocetra persica]
MNTLKFKNELAVIQIEENLKHESKMTYNQLYQFATNLDFLIIFVGDKYFFAIIIGAFSLANIASDLQAFAIVVGADAKILETIDLVLSIDLVSLTDNMSLYIKSRISVAIVSASGSGKSMIMLLLNQQISLVEQEPVLFNDTIFNNIVYGLIDLIYEDISDEIKYKRIKNACEIFNADEFIVRLSNQYETIVAESGILLSRDQKQPITIARAIIKDLKILFLDKATSALDSQSKKIVQDVLNKASKNRTM